MQACAVLRNYLRRRSAAQIRRNRTEYRQFIVVTRRRKRQAWRYGLYNAGNLLTLARHSFLEFNICPEK